MLGSHHVWLEATEEAGVSLVRLPVTGGYLVNTEESHSELHGPFGTWCHELNRAVRIFGAPLDDRLAACFGLTLELVEAASGAIAR